MTDALYFCTKENNTCPKKETCERYIESDDSKNNTTLFCTACTENNSYVLYIKHSKEGEKVT